MSSLHVQMLVIAAAACGLLAVTIALVRRNLLAIRYGLGWITVGLLTLAATPFAGSVNDIARVLGVSPLGVTLSFVVVFLMMVCIQLSISLSGLHHAVQDLSERSALIEQRVRAVERETAAGEQLERPAPAGRRRAAQHR